MAVPPKRSANATQRLNEFHMNVGACITQWAAIEGALYEICHKALRSDHHGTAIVFYRTPNLRQRLELTSELVYARLPKRTRRNGGHDHPHVDRWKALSKEFIALLEDRNHIAHTQAVGIPIIPHRITANGNTVIINIMTDEHIYELRASFYENFRTGTRKVIKQEDLPSLIDRLAKLRAELMLFDNEIMQPLLPPPQLSPPPTG